MNEELEVALKKLIKERLPKYLSPVLKEELTTELTLAIVATVQDDIKRNKVVFAQQDKTIASLKEEIEVLKERELDVAKKDIELTKREVSIKAKEDKQCLLELELRLNKEFRTEIKDLSLAFVRSPVITKTSSGYTPVATDGGSNGSTGYPIPGTVTSAPFSSTVIETGT